MRLPLAFARCFVWACYGWASSERSWQGFYCRDANGGYGYGYGYGYGHDDHGCDDHGCDHGHGGSTDQSDASSSKYVGELEQAGLGLDWEEEEDAAQARHVWLDGLT
jgi:hypothetical protein